ncbi:MAG TPA: hypothetical protein VFM44_07590 [Gemmatimonadota bacterium]|nr:hypothetical protein [Gemmatimonadota bacterium]
MVVVTVTDPAVPAEKFTFVEYVPAVVPERLTEIETVFCELAAIVPDIALRASQPTPSVAVQDTDWLPVFLSVTERLVAVLPKSSWTGVTAKVAVPDAATLIFTLTASVPPSEEIVTPVVYAPAARPARCTLREICLGESLLMVPELVPSDSQLALSVAVQASDRLELDLRVIEADVELVPRSI